MGFFGFLTGSKKKTSQTHKTVVPQKSHYIAPDWYHKNREFEFQFLPDDLSKKYPPELPLELADDLRTLLKSIVGSPPQALKIAQKLDQKDIDQSEVVQLVSSDPVLVSAIMKDVNSAYFGISQQVTQINRAIPLLGIHNVKLIALRLCKESNILAKKLPPEITQRIKTHADVSASVAFLLAQKHPDLDPYEIRTLALLHNMGSILYLIPKIQKLMRTKTPNITPDIHRAWLSYIFADLWDLPDFFKIVVASVAYPLHHSLETLDKAIKLPAIIMHVAKSIAQAYGFSENDADLFINKESLNYLDLDQNPHHWANEKIVKAMDLSQQLS